jgi:serine/threonine protein kinase
MNTIQEGGKLISEGGYGCVYYPHLDCSLKESTTNKDEYISKVQRYNDAAKNEINIGNIVKTIKNYKNFFAPIIDSCVIKDLSPLQKNYETCDILSKKNPGKKYLLMKLPYAGSQTFFKYFIEAANAKEMILNTLTTYSYLIAANQKLFEKGIIHYDLKGENIMFNSQKKVPIVIDFGLSIELDKVKNMKDLSNAFYIYAPDYYLWCPEIQYLSYLANENPYPTQDEIHDIVDNIVTSNTPLSDVCSPSFIKQYSSSLRRYLVTFLNKKPMDVFHKMREIAHTWDNYSISIMYLRVLRYLNNDGFENNDFVIFFMKLLIQNVHPNPTRRLSSKETITLFNNYSYKKNFAKSNEYTSLFKSLVTNQKKVASMVTTDERNLNSILQNKQ